MTTSPAPNVPEHSSLAKWADKKQVQDPSYFGSALRYLVRLLLIIFNEFQINELSVRSSALTYAILLSLVPMLAMSTAVVKGLGGGDQLRQAAYSYLETLEESNGLNTTENREEPAPATADSPKNTATLTNHLRSAIDKLFDYVDRTNFATLGTIGVVGILLSVLVVLGNIESAMNAIWKVSAGRSILRKIADYLTLLILMPLSINVAFAASAFLKNPVLAAKMDTFIPGEWLQALLLKPIPIFFIALAFCAMYIFFPNTKVKTVPAMLGATLAAILWFGVQNVYIGLQVGVAKYNAIYGSFATLPLFLVWMYLGWMFILTGAQVAFALQNCKTYRLVPIPDGPSLKLGAAFDIMDRVYSGLLTQQPITSTALTDQLPQHSQSIIGDVVEQLIEAGQLHVSQTDGRLLPAFPAEQYDSGKVVQIILGSDAPETAGGKQSRIAVEAAGEGSRQYQSLTVKAGEVE
jgi:membrane protein